MKFIELTQMESDRPMAVPVNNIMGVIDAGISGTRLIIGLAAGGPLTVTAKETVADILRLISLTE